jgi:hypothetical protein
MHFLPNRLHHHFVSPISGPKHPGKMLAMHRHLAILPTPFFGLCDQNACLLHHTSAAIAIFFAIFVPVYEVMCEWATLNLEIYQAMLNSVKLQYLAMFTRCEVVLTLFARTGRYVLPLLPAMHVCGAIKYSLLYNCSYTICILGAINDIEASISINIS